jgi:hypothetical protein
MIRILVSLASSSQDVKEDLNTHVESALLELGQLPDRHTRYQLERVAKMSVRKQNSTAPDENI